MLPILMVSVHRSWTTGGFLYLVRKRRSRCICQLARARPRAKTLLS